MAWWEIALIVVFGYTALVFLVLLWRAAGRPVCAWCSYPLHRCECDPYEQDVDRPERGLPPRAD